MAVAPGGMPEPRTCTLPFPSPTLIAVVFCRCWSNGCASSLLYEPPYTEPYVRWCGRTAEVTPPPTRLKATETRSSWNEQRRWTPTHGQEESHNIRLKDCWKESN